MGLNLTKPKFVSPSLHAQITCHMSVWQVSLHTCCWPNHACYEIFVAPAMNCVVLVWDLIFGNQLIVVEGKIFSRNWCLPRTVLSRVRSADMPRPLIGQCPVSRPLIGPGYQVLDLCRVTSRCNLYWSPRELECPDIPRHRQEGCDQALYTLTWSPAHDDDEPGQPPGWWLVMSRDI